MESAKITSRTKWNRGWFDPLLVAAWTLLICALPSAMSKVWPAFAWNHPTPGVLDEFSYLLAADTFAHGRLTNPTPVMWEHFETFYVVMRPTYMSKYPPGQGMALALGELLGDPLYGAWIAMSVACAAITWAIRPWLGRRWALAMGLMLPTLPILHWWSQSYWGGAVQMLGGALLIGAAARAVVIPNLALGMTAGLGALLLSISRPFEGVLLCAILGAALVVMWIRRGIGPTWFIIGAALIGAIAVPINLYYNFRLTTSPFTMPYALHSRQYMRVPQFFWQGLAPAKAIQHPHLAWFYTVHEPAEVQVQTGSLSNFFLGMWLKWKLLAGSFLNPPVLSVLLFGALLAWRQKRARLAWLAWLVIVALPLVQMSITPWMREHYMAPAMAAWIAILGIGARVIWRWKPGGVRIGPLLLAVILAVHLYLSCDWAIAMNRQGAQTSGTARAKFIEMLKQEPGEDLVLVDCPPDEPGDPPGYRSVDDWVYNDADIDHSPVIFAHWMSDAQNAEIMNHYPQRHVWYVRLVPGGTSVRRMR